VEKGGKQQQEEGSEALNHLIQSGWGCAMAGLAAFMAPGRR